MSNDYNELREDLTEIFTKDPAALQKKYQNKAYENYLNKFRHHVHLWELTDKDWVKYRKEVWDKIIEREKLEDEDFSKSYWEVIERFFLRAKPRKNDNELCLYRRMTYTPFKSISDIVEQYSKEHVSLKRNLHENLLTYASRAYRAIPEEFHRIQLIADALYTKEHVANMEKMGHDQESDFVVYYPRDFIVRYASEACNYINRSSLRDVPSQFYSGHERSFVEVTFDFFLGSLEYAMSDNAREFTGTINDQGFNGVKEMCGLIEAYSPEIKDKNRDTFIEKSQDRILKNDQIKKILAMIE